MNTVSPPHPLDMKITSTCTKLVVLHREKLFLFLQMIKPLQKIIENAVLPRWGRGLQDLFASDNDWPKGLKIFMGDMTQGGIKLPSVLYVG